MTAEYSLFAACLPGLEPLLSEESRQIGADPGATRGGVAFTGDRDLLLAAHLQLGTASHLLLRCGSFHCINLRQLQRRVSELPWAKWLRSDTPVSVRATATRSRLYHTGAIAERVRTGIATALNSEPDPEDASSAASVTVRLVSDRVTVSLDTSYEPLHRRGYRLDGAKAPLREDLAHALLLAAGYRGDMPLLDPFCGAGTIAIEAAQIATKRPPGRLRPAPLGMTPMADEDRWHQLLEQTAPSQPEAAIAASDRDQGAAEAAVANAERADCATAISCTVGAFGAHPWFETATEHPKGLIVTNPPFGRRIARGNNLRNLYQALGHRVQSLGPGWRVAILTSDIRLARRTGLPLRAAFTTRHGGLSVTALVTDSDG
ncbi:MAG: class I SAM-dependent RNA methyltransferase [Planctomycetota bacterium]|nr:class I SAM-dependent RNA methyltransferase [Planctomycetota bacterium]